MPITTPEGIRVPAISDNYALTEDLRLMAESIESIAPVPNAAARASLLSALTAAGRESSEANPTFVHREDGPDLEVNTGGTEWRTVGAPEIHVGPNPVGETLTSSALALELTLPSKTYRRRLICHGSLYGSVTSGIWDTALSVNQAGVATAQRYARLSTGGNSASMTLPFTLEAGVTGTVRLWYRLVSGTGSLVTSANTQYSNLTVEAWRI